MAFTSDNWINAYRNPGNFWRHYYFDTWSNESRLIQEKGDGITQRWCRNGTTPDGYKVDGKVT